MIKIITVHPITIVNMFINEAIEVNLFLAAFAKEKNWFLQNHNKFTDKHKNKMLYDNIFVLWWKYYSYGKNR